MQALYWLALAGNIVVAIACVIAMYAAWRLDSEGYADVDRISFAMMAGVTVLSIVNCFV